jgi:hypothetical protein
MGEFVNLLMHFCKASVSMEGLALCKTLSHNVSRNAVGKVAITHYSRSKCCITVPAMLLPGLVPGDVLAGCEYLNGL